MFQLSGFYYTPAKEGRSNGSGQGPEIDLGLSGVCMMWEFPKIGIGDPNIVPKIAGSLL